MRPLDALIVLKHAKAYLYLTREESSDVLADLILSLWDSPGFPRRAYYERMGEATRWTAT